MTNDLKKRVILAFHRHVELFPDYYHPLDGNIFYRVPSSDCLVNLILWCRRQNHIYNKGKHVDLETWLRLCCVYLCERYLYFMDDCVEKIDVWDGIFKRVILEYRR